MLNLNRIFFEIFTYNFEKFVKIFIPMKQSPFIVPPNNNMIKSCS